MLDFKATTRRHQAFTHPNILFSVYFLSDKTCYENIRLKLTEDLTPILKQITKDIKNANNETINNSIRNVRF